MRLNKLIGWILIGIFIGSAGCTSLMSRTIEYDFDDIEQINNERLGGITLDIRPFADLRMNNPENAILFSRGKDVEINDEDYCINSEKHYSMSSAGDVPLQLAKTIAQHLNKRGAFKNVTLNEEKESEDPPEIKKPTNQRRQEKIPADFYLTGNIKRIYGEQEYTGAAQTLGILLGPLFMMAAMVSVETPLKIEIEITDLAIYSNDRQLVANLEDIQERYEEEATRGDECLNVYGHVNLKLKPLIDKLAGEIENKLANHISR